MSEEEDLSEQSELLNGADSEVSSKSDEEFDLDRFMKK